MLATLLGSVVAPLVFGHGLVRWLGLPATAGLRVTFAFAYLVGHFVLAVGTAARLALVRDLPGVALPIVAACAGLGLLVRARRRDATDPAGQAAFRITTMDELPRAAFVILTLLLVNACTVTNVQPIRFGDEAQIWAAKAKALFAADTIDLRTSMGTMVSHPDYPPLNPLVQAWSFATAGHVQHWENRIPIQCFGIALLALLSAAMARRAHPALAAIVLIAFAGSLFWSQAQVAYSDVLLAFAALATVDAVLRLRETGSVVWWRLACLGLAAMLATKNEGSLLAIAIAVPFAPTALRRVPRREVAWLLVPLATVAAHRAFNAWFDLRSDLLDPAAAAGRGLIARFLHDAPDRLPTVLAFYGRMLIDPAPHRGIPALLFAAAAIAFAAPSSRTAARAALPLLVTVVAALVGYALVFTTTPADLQWHLDTAAARTLLQVVPIAALALAMTAWPRAAGVTTDATARPAPPS